MRSVVSRYWVLFGLLPLTLAAWLVQHPYQGVVHDSMLYAFQAMQSQHPAFGADLFLKYGSQDEYTLFNPIYGAAIGFMGLELASKLFVAVGMAAWLAGALFLFIRIFGDKWPIAFLFVAAANPSYGLSYAEGFVTPRLFVEAMSLFAFRLLVDHRLVACFALLCAAALLHPIVALGSFGLAIVYLSLIDRRWLVLPALGVVLAFGLAFVGQRPFDGLLVSFDPAWLEVLEMRNIYLFIGGRRAEVWFLQISDIAFLLTAFILSVGLLRRVWLTALLVLLLTMFATFVFADLLANVLGTQLQPWRTNWITHLLAMASVGIMTVQRDWLGRAGWAGIVVLCASLICLAASSFTNLANIHQAASAVLLLLVVVLSFPASAFPDLRRLARLLLAAGAAVVAGAALLEALIVFANFRIFAGFMAQVADYVTAESFLIPFAAIIIGAIAATRRNVAFFGLSGAVGLMLTTLAVSELDRRSDWAIMIEKSEGSLPGFPVAVDEDESVLWQGSSYYSEPWLGMRRSAYLSVPQGAGLVFSRGTAMEFLRRGSVASAIDADFIKDFRDRTPGDRPVLNRDDFSDVCADNDAPSLFVLTEPVKGADGVIWDSPVSTTRGYATDYVGPATRLADYGIYAISRFYLYRCTDLTG